MSLGSILTGAVKILASTNPVTGILADALLPERVAKQTGAPADLVSKIISGIQGDPEVTKLQIEAEKTSQELLLQAAQIESGNLRALDTGAEFSFWKGLVGSPRRFAVTVLSGVIGFLGLNAGIRALWIGGIAVDPDGLLAIFKTLGGTLALLTGAYVSKYWGKGQG